MTKKSTVAHRAKVYWTVWSTIAKYAFAETFQNRWTNLLFLTGKVVRFGMLLFFLFFIRNSVSSFAGYTPDQMVAFFLTYQLMDTLAQVFYRGVYSFSNQVKSGELDFYLSKPINPLFRILTGKPDFIDVIFFIPTTLVSFYILREFFVHAPFESLAAYFLLLINGFLIATAFHVLILVLGVITVEVDNAVMLYRDINVMARFPVTIYQEPIRTILLFAIPVGVMNTIPAQVLTQTPTTVSIGVAGILGISFFMLSLRLWSWAIKRYTSAGG